jgi:hypothetical protein
MPLPSSGTLGIQTIASTGGTNAVGMVTPNSLYQLNVIAGLDYNFGSKISNFYNYGGYGYRYGSPDTLYDIGLSSRYSTSSSNIIDTSGNSRNATFVTGTGTGTPANITGLTSTFPGNIATQTSNQRSIRLDDYTKYAGNTTFTWIAWFKVTSFVSSYNGIISCEGRSGSTPIGHSLYINNVGGYNVVYERWNGTSGSSNAIILPFNSGGAPAFETNRWYMVMMSYSSTYFNMCLRGSNWTSTYGSQGGFVSTSVSTSGSWSCFAGLRYNNWLDGHIGYVATYSSLYSGLEFNSIWDRTQKRYV